MPITRTSAIVLYASLFSLIGATVPRQASALIPPWYFYQRLLKLTVGASPCVRVGELEAPQGDSREYNLTVQACTPESASALAAVLTAHANSVAIHVLGPTGQPAVPVLGAQPGTEEVKNTLRLGLDGNRYVAGASERGAMATAFSVILKPLVVQIASDNIADPFHNTNLTAQEAFARVLAHEFGTVRIGFTTVPHSDER